jgi:drug/metabolite transporter (DMT)-like permease
VNTNPRWLTGWAAVRIGVALLAGLAYFLWLKNYAPLPIVRSATLTDAEAGGVVFFVVLLALEIINYLACEIRSRSTH